MPETSSLPGRLLRHREGGGEPCVMALEPPFKANNLRKRKRLGLVLRVPWGITAFH